MSTRARKPPRGIRIASWHEELGKPITQLIYTTILLQHCVVNLVSNYFLKTLSNLLKQVVTSFVEKVSQPLETSEHN